MNLRKFTYSVVAAVVWFTAVPLQAIAADGLIVLVGDVLPLKNQVVWRNLVRLSERREGEHLVIAAAHKRPKVYGGFTLRAYQRYGKTAELIPLAEEFQQFSTDYRYLAKDSATADRIRMASSIFFVGGPPQQLSKVLFDRKDRPTPLANAIKEAFETGSLIVGGIPGRKVVSTGVDPLHALEDGKISDKNYAEGLDILEHDWFVDQHFFGSGRFAMTLVAMYELGMKHGIGVGLDTAAVINGSTVEVLGNRGVVVVDLTESSIKRSRKGLIFKNIRLNYLENGDRIEVYSGKVTPYRDKQNGFELTSQGTASSKTNIVSSRAMFAAGELYRLMYEAIDSKSGQSLAYALHHDDEEGFEFRFHTREDSRGWLSVEGDQERVTMEKIYLDIKPL